MPSFFDLEVLDFFLQIKQIEDEEIPISSDASLILPNFFSSFVSILKDITPLHYDFLVFSLCVNSRRFLILLFSLLLSI